VFQIDPEFGHWLAGFVDGEGSFTIASQSRVKGNRGSFACIFKIALHADDAPILWEISERTGIGTVRTGTPKSQKGPRATWAVQSKHDCLRLIEILERFPLRAKKARDFKIWSEAVHEWATKYRGGKDQDWSRLAELRVELSQGRPRRGRLPDLVID
jgi:hypothetical protein